jgi:hypothetical protein
MVSTTKKLCWICDRLVVTRWAHEKTPTHIQRLAAKCPRPPSLDPEPAPGPLEHLEVVLGQGQQRGKLSL